MHVNTDGEHVTMECGSSLPLYVPIQSTHQIAEGISLLKLPLVEEVGVLNALVEVQMGEQVVSLKEQIVLQTETNASKQLPHCLKVLLKFGTSHLGLVFILAAYSFIGAAIFTAIEDLTGLSTSLDISRNDTFDNHTLEVIIDFTDKMFDAQGDVVSFKSSEMILMMMRYERAKQKDFREEHEWVLSHEYYKWLLFCFTTYTTIGNLPI